MALSKSCMSYGSATALLWLLRTATGAVFIISGWAKCVDIRGFCLKAYEYLTAFGTDMPSELVLVGATGVSVLEFVTGILLATGCLRRAAVRAAAAFMAVMLPLTLWIAITNPVSDCGCFGDFIILSNGATFVKNLFITAAVALLWIFNLKRSGLYPVPVQWLVIAVSCIYPLYIVYEGYQTQPLIDFRPFKTGTMLYDEDSEEFQETYVYSKDGHEAAFALDALPDSSWTYVRMELNGATKETITVYSPDGDDITDEFAETLSESPRTVLLVVSNPEEQFMTRAHYLQELHDYLADGGIRMFGLVGASGESFDRWRRLTRPNFPAYEAEDTSLKMLVRGSAGIVYLREGRIIWKSTLGSLSPELPYSGKNPAEVFDSISPVDSGKHMLRITGLYLGAMLLLYALGLSPRMLSLLLRVTSPGKRQKRNSPDKKHSGGT